MTKSDNNQIFGLTLQIVLNQVRPARDMSVPHGQHQREVIVPYRTVPTGHTHQRSFELNL